jgi:membrane associated rhomboid family serine protease
MTTTTDRTNAKIQILGTLVALAWIVTILDTCVYDRQLIHFGIIPRDPIGLRGILLAPFLHANYLHLAVNTIPFIVLGWSIMAQAIANFTIVSIICLVVGGLGTWLSGPTNFVYIFGAGGLICGYISYLLALYYFFDRRLQSSGLIALFIGCTYGIVRANLPAVSGILWQEVIFGCVSGLLSAKLVFKK